MKRTKYEKKFFRIAESFSFEFDEQGNYSFEKFDRKLYDIIIDLQDEIIENCTHLNTAESHRYINRLKSRLEYVGIRWYFKDRNKEESDKTGFDGLIPLHKATLRVDKNNEYRITEDEEIQYFEMLNKHKHLLLQAIKKVESTLTPQEPKQRNPTKAEKFYAKHYLLAYLFECNAKGESYPLGNKTELERIGNERMGEGKGNRFYKVFNEIIKKDLNDENDLIEIGGEDWKKVVLELSNSPELVKIYLQNKQL